MWDKDERGEIRNMTWDVRWNMKWESDKIRYEMRYEMRNEMRDEMTDESWHEETWEEMSEERWDINKMREPGVCLTWHKCVLATVITMSDYGMLGIIRRKVKECFSRTLFPRTLYQWYVGILSKWVCVGVRNNTLPRLVGRRTHQAQHVNESIVYTQWNHFSIENLFLIIETKPLAAKRQLE